VPLPEPLVEAYLKASVTNYCNKAQVVTTPVPSARERLIAQGVVTPIEIVPNPIDLESLPVPDPASVRKQWGLAPDAYVMGYVGRLAPEKNLHTVLEAAAQIMASDPNARFLMVGDGAERAALKQRVEELGLDERVVFTGAVERDQVPHYQAALDVFMTASMSETQPLAYTEAMAVGTPVVAVRAPGAQDMIEDGVNGLLCEPQEGAQGLARLVQRLRQEPGLRAAISANSRQHVRRYDLSVVTDRLLEVYQMAIERFEAAEEPRRRRRP